jgi:DNA-binding transcriptional ArsR family regulator
MAPGFSIRSAVRLSVVTSERSDGQVSPPLYQAKADLFKTLGHPTRIRVLELLVEGEHSVGELLPHVGIEASNLSQQLAVLRHAGLVTTRRQGTTVYYALAAPEIAEFLAIARKILTEVLSGQMELLRDLQGPDTGRVA